MFERLIVPNKYLTDKQHSLAAKAIYNIFILMNEKNGLLC
jgi:hypothetical protein